VSTAVGNRQVRLPFRSRLKPALRVRMLPIHEVRLPFRSRLKPALRMRMLPIDEVPPSAFLICICISICLTALSGLFLAANAQQQRLDTLQPALAPEPLVAQQPIVAPQPPANSHGSASSTNGTAGGAGSKAKVPAQSIVQGKVTDFANGKSIAEAIVALTHPGPPPKHLKFETEFDGVFKFENLEAGEWTVTISAPGKFSFTRKVKLSGTDTATVDAQMEEQEAVETLRVTGKRTLIHPERIGSTTSVDRRFLDQYKSGNDLRDVILSTPGVQRDSFGNIITRGEHNAINYEIDGAILPETSGVLNQAQFANPRSLQSLSVDIGGYEAHDGGGPLGAVVRMKSLPTSSKPVLEWGGQLGGPLAGSLHYFASTPLSLNPKGVLNRIRVESSGTAVPTTLGIAPPVKKFARNSRLDLNFLNKIEFQQSEKNRFTLTTGINETFLQIPTSGASHRFGVGLSEHDRQDYIIATWKRTGDKWMDEGNLHIINAFYSQTLRSNNVFDPYPILNGEGADVVSVAPRGKRRNYVCSIQGNAKKTVFKTHFLETGFLTELRPVRTKYGAIYRNANLFTTASSQGEFQQAQIDAAAAASEEFLAGVSEEAFNAAIADGADEEAAAAAAALAVQSAGNAAQQAAGEAALAVPNTVIPFGGIISPFTGLPGGPQFSGEIGKFKGFRYLQSAYLQDTWKPKGKILSRLTLNAGVRADVYHGVFGNTLPVAAAILTIPDVEPFQIAPFQKQKVTNAQASGRFGGSIVVTKNTVVRGSYSDIFQPPPVDVFSTPPLVSEGAVNGIFPFTVRPLQATRGRLVDCSVETQVGPRFVTRTNFFYKKLKNFGDSGVIVNTPLYNRVSLDLQEAYGVESRVDLKPARDGYGLNGFLSSTFQVAKLRGTKTVTGGIYEFEPEAIKYPDHDRRYSLQAGLGYRTKKNFWCLAELSFMTGLQDQRDFNFFGPHPARTPPVTLIGLNGGYSLPKDKKAGRLRPSSIDVRIQNLLNQRVPLNLGSPFQGTRYQLPIRILAGVNWQV
jgi:hypothetical protein